jgi:hypothetical protein
MPFNGQGLFTRVYQWANDLALGLDVDANRTDTDSNDIAAGLSNCITRDGQSPPTENLPMGNMKLTGLAAGTNAADSVNYGQVFVNPVFTNPSATSSPPFGDASLALATMAALAAASFSSALPGISPATKGMFITNDAVSASWGRARTTAGRLYSFRNL